MEATYPVFSSRQSDRSRRSTISLVISRSRTRLFEGKWYIKSNISSSRIMLHLQRLLFVVATRSFHPRRDLLLENLALRQQLAALKGRRPQARLTVTDKWFWVMLRRLLPGWRQALMPVQPENGRRLAALPSRANSIGYEVFRLLWQPDCVDCTLPQLNAPVSNRRSWRKEGFA